MDRRQIEREHLGIGVEALWQSVPGLVRIQQRPNFRQIEHYRFPDL